MLDNRADSLKVAFDITGYEKERDYWLNKLSGELLKSSFPYDIKKKNQPGPRMESLEFEIPGDLLVKMTDLSGGMDHRLHIILQAGLVAAIARYTGHSDIIIGEPIYKQPVDGKFINTVLALRNQVEVNMSFRDLLLQVRQTLNEAAKNQNYPFETLLYQLQMDDDGEECPLFDIVMMMENLQDEKYIAHIHRNLTISFMKSENLLQGTAAYNSLLYDRATIEQIIHRYTRILRAAVFNLDMKVLAVDILSSQEKKMLLVDFNTTRVPYPGDKTIHRLFDETAAEAGEKVALGFEDELLTYGELKRRTRRLAEYLSGHGVSGDMGVAIMAGPSVETVVGILAVLKAGGFYLPVDVEYPAERKKYILEDSNVKVILSDCGAGRDGVPEGAVVIPLGAGQQQSAADGCALERKHRYDNLAYIIYTSGTTGNPKGVMVMHRNVVRLVKNTNYVQLGKDDRILQTGALEFDASTFEIWGALLNGIGLYLADKEELIGRESLKQLIVKHRISTMWLTSALFNQMVDLDIGMFATLGSLLVGGEALSPVHIKRVKDRYPGINIINGYGPTENTTFSTTYAIKPGITGNIPIGRPIANSTAYILDKLDNLVPVGAAGELAVGGEGVARGYQNNVELTAAKFIIKNRQLKIENRKNSQTGNKRQPRANNRLYRTGDLARWQPDGNIDFLGRLDHQVKVRGYRIEPGEIETHLRGMAFIKEAVVMAREGQDGEKTLCAYVVTGKEIDRHALMAELSGTLPHYMVPTQFVRLKEIPLTANKKVDVNALSALEVVDMRASYTAPGNETEEKLVEIWSKVLAVDKKKLGIDTDFFDLGGHSLKATILISDIHEAFNIKIPLGEIFRTPTIRELARYLEKTAKNKAPQTQYATIKPVEEKEYYELSSAQKRLYILQKIYGVGTTYNVPLALLCEGNLDHVKLENTFKQLIRRHESLRTSIDMIGGGPVQKVHREVEFAIEYFDITPGDAGEEKTGLVIHDFIKPFDLSQAPLLRVGLIKIGVDRHILVVDMHHIITDGTSCEVLKYDFAVLFREEALPTLKIQYRDFSRWQNREQEKESHKRREAYWMKEFAGEIPVLNLAADYPRPALQDFSGSHLYFEISEAETGALKQIAAREGATLFMVLLAVTNIFLSRLSGQEDIVIGTPIAGRRHANLEPLMGMFVNTLALRNYPAGHKVFREFLREIKASTLAAFENQDYQYEDLVDQVVSTRDASRNPLFDVLLVLQNTATQALDIPGIRIAPYENDGQTAKFDLSLGGAEAEGKLRLTLEYSTRLYKRETAARFIDYFMKIVKCVIADPGQRISHIEMIPEAEKNRLLYDFNGPLAEFPLEKTIHGLFAEQAAGRPDSTAVVGGRHDTPAVDKKRKMHITYDILNKKADRLAHLLKGKGVQAETIVGIMVERSIEMIVGILGILKAGGAYMPIDVDYPRERINYIAADSKIGVLVTAGDLVEKKKMANSKLSIVNCELPASEPPASLHHSSSIVQHSRHLVYVIYTSGSTGRPKGTLVEHRSVINTLSALDEMYPFEESDIYLLKTSYTFDVSAAELFGWFWGGGALVLLETQGEKDPYKISEMIESCRVTHINFVPSMFNVFVEIFGSENISKLSSLRYIFLAGEALLPDVVKRFRALNSKIKLENIYGPTEAAVYACNYSLSSRDAGGSIPIGKPLANMKLYMIDMYGHLQPLGVAGELCISGPGVSRGYLNQPGLTAEKFIEYSPDRSAKASIFYKTGDFCRMRPDGNIEFLGRIDHQVKVRGFRIEPGEIESKLMRHKSVKEAVVVAKEAGKSNNCLCVYFVPPDPPFNSDEGKNKEMIAELRNFLAGELPNYMIPAHFIPIETIPLTPGGKLDRQALPEPDVVKNNEYIAPRSEVERKLVKIWSDVLGLASEEIGIADNFFQLGGNSLNATLMVSRIHQEMNVKLSPGSLFKTPKIIELARQVKESAKNKFISIVPVEKKEWYALSSGQKRLYILQQLAPTSTFYNIPSIFEIEGDFSGPRIEDAFKKMLNRHESLRTNFHLVKGEPVQKVHHRVDFAVDYREGAAGEAGMPDMDFIKPFDLTRAPLLKVKVIKITGSKHLLLVDIHHIIIDGISMAIFCEDFLALYAGKELAELPIHYKDFSQWQDKRIKSEGMKAQEDYWTKEFAGGVPVLSLPTDYPRQTQRDFQGNLMTLIIHEDETAALNAMAREEGVTMFMLLLAQFNILLARLSGQEDITIGTAAAARGQADLERVLGMFVNTAALRNFPTGDKTFKEFLKEVKGRTLKVFENQDYPFEELVEKLKIKKDPAHNPLFDVGYGIQIMNRPELSIPGMTLKPVEYESRTSKFDLSFSVLEEDGRLIFSVEYCTALFKKETIERFFKYFKEIVSAVLQNRDLHLKDIQVTHMLLKAAPKLPQVEFVIS